jgi:hypothetical protein
MGPCTKARNTQTGDRQANWSCMFGETLAARGCVGKKLVAPQLDQGCRSAGEGIAPSIKVLGTGELPAPSGAILDSMPPSPIALFAGHFRGRRVIETDGRPRHKSAASKGPKARPKKRVDCKHTGPILKRNGMRLRAHLLRENGTNMSHGSKHR